MKTLLILLLSLNLFCENLKINDIIKAEKINESHLILVDSGEVFELDPENQKFLEEIEWALKNNYKMDLFLKKNTKKSLNYKRRTIENFRFIGDEINDDVFFDFVNRIPTPMDSFKVADAVNFNVIKKMFAFQKNYFNRTSQCYNRAHIWAHDLATKFMPERLINTGKLWIFFTRKYIREYNYKWWFHITPYTHLKGDSRMVMLDRTYLKSPKFFESWKNIFMKNNAPCTEVAYYSHYRENQQAAYCYVIRSSMYFYQPYQIKNLEKGFPIRDKFLEHELDMAYRDAL